MPDLKVTAEADVKPAVKGLQDVQKELLATAGAASKVNPAMQTVQSALAKTALSANALDSSLKKVVPGANQAGQALTNVGRVAQDLPFGFIGIQNNLNPLLESFQRLKTETGSSGAAFKALGSSLIGAGGIGLALSVVSSAIVIFQNGIAGFNKKSKEAKERTDELAKSLHAAAEATAQEAGDVVSLIAVLNNQNESYKRKSDALKELQKLQPEYFSNLSLEKGAVVGLQQAYQAYLANLKNVFAAKILQSKLDAELTKLVELEGAARTKSEKQGRGLLKFYTESADASTDAAKKSAAAIAKIKSEAIATAGSLDPILASKGRIKDLMDSLSELSSNVKVTVNKDKAEKDVRTIADVLRELRLELDALNTREIQLGTNEAKGKINALEGAIKELITKFGKPGKDNTIQLFAEIREIEFIEKLKQNLQTDVKGKEIKIEPIVTVDPVIKRGDFENRLAKFLFDKEAFANKVKEFNQLVQTSIDQIKATAFTALGEAIGGALSGEGFNVKGLFDTLFSSVGDEIQNLGKFLIKTGVAVKAAKTAFENLLKSPAAQIAVGVGLVALGALLKSISKNKPKGFASGSTSTPGGNFLVGERGPERIFLPQGSRVQPNNELQAYGGGMQPIVLDHRISGADLVIVQRRAQASMNRAGNIASY